jgi:NADPH:quinone reductase-like Zn-dependent oxidoreductase
MLAAYLKGHGGPETVEVGELPTPEPRADQVRVKVRAAALNHLDLWVRRGLPSLKLTYPHILGGDAAGVVDKLGPDATGVKVGDEVIVHPGLSCRRCRQCLGGWESLCPQYQILGEHVNGAHAEWVCIPVANVFAKPAALSFEQAAALPLVFTTAWQMLVRRAQVQPGEWVLVHAAGSGVGSAAIQIARLYGAQVIATAGSEAKLELARKLGAQVTIDYTNADFAKEVRRVVPQGCDIIVDHLGKEFWKSNFRAVRDGGRITVCGATSGYEAVTDLRHVFYRQIQILGSTMGSKGDFETLLQHVERGSLKPVVDRAFALREARLAHERLERREQFGKVLLIP